MHAIVIMMHSVYVPIQDLDADRSSDYVCPKKVLWELFLLQSRYYLQGVTSVHENQIKDVIMH